MQRAARGQCWAISFALLMLSAGRATAQAESADSGAYRDLVGQALREFQLGNYDEAKVYFAQAHALSPSARTMRGLGISAYEMREYVEAIQWLDDALRSTQNPLTPQMRVEATKLLNQARTFVARLRLNVRPSRAQVRIDAQPVRKDADGYIAIGAGPHELVVEAEEFEALTRSVRIAAGEVLTLDLELRPRQQASPQKVEAPVDALEPANTPHEGETPSDSGTGSAGPWIVIAASSAVALTGAVLLAVALSSKGTVEHPSGYMPRYDRAAADRVLPFSVAGIAALSLGGASLIAGIVWKLTSDRDDSQSGVSARLELMPSGVRLHGQF